MYNNHCFGELCVNSQMQRQSLKKTKGGLLLLALIITKISDWTGSKTWKHDTRGLYLHKHNYKFNLKGHTIGLWLHNNNIGYIICLYVATLNLLGNTSILFSSLEMRLIWWAIFLMHHCDWHSCLKVMRWAKTMINHHTHPIYILLQQTLLCIVSCDLCLHKRK